MMEMPHKISLRDLIAGIDVSRIDGDHDIDITDVVSDSRLAGPGHLFFALDGDRVDGRHFIEEAHRSGAAAVMGEAPIEAPPGCTGITIPNVRAVIGTIASRFFDHPSDRLVTIGVTGTNGKTTITYLLDAILRSAGMSPGVVGTISHRFGGRTLKAVNTTPEAPELQRILDEMTEAGTTHAVMEVSSHGLALGRVNGCRFNVGVFTNLSQDHLDFHKTMESYLEAKSRLFTSLLFPGQGMEEPAAVINIDDPAGARLAGMTAAHVITYGIDGDAAIRPSRFDILPDRIEADIEGCGEPMHIRSKLIGRFNLYNILAATGAACALGIDPRAIAAGIEGAAPVPGRLELVAEAEGRRFFIDYAHTPDALDQVLQSLSALGKGRLITVFGCGGDRDPEKRPVMGGRVAKWSGVAVVTSDNPRSEDPQSIIDAIEPGLAGAGSRRVEPWTLPSGPSGKCYCVEPDRHRAIALAAAAAVEGDTVLVAGKGHEDYQIIGSSRLHFDDREEIGRVLDEETASFSVQDACKAVAGEILTGRPEARLAGLSTDSRAIKAGELFIPISGERFDGHDFIDAAMKAGAAGAFLEPGHRELVPGIPKGRAIIRVADALRALGDLAAARRISLSLPVVAITGTNGKTTTREMTASIFDTTKKVLRPLANFNNLVGLPLTLLRLKPSHEIAVVELGMSERGEIRRLTEIAKPDVGVITCVGPAHLDGLGSVEAVALAKAEILESMAPGAAAVLNKDDLYYDTMRSKWGGRLLTFGVREGSDVRAERIVDRGFAGFTVLIEVLGETIEANLHILGRQNIANALAAAAAAAALGTGLDEIRRGLERFRPFPRRMNMVQLRDGGVLVDDTYNANPRSMEAALRTSAALPGRGDLVAILGDMLELGGRAAEYHEAAGRLLAECGYDQLFALGRWAEVLSAGARAEGMEAKNIHLCGSRQEIVEAIGKTLKPEDRILVKGSRGMAMELISDAIAERLGR